MLFHHFCGDAERQLVNQRFADIDFRVSFFVLVGLIFLSVLSSDHVDILVAFLSIRHALLSISVLPAATPIFVVAHSVGVVVTVVVDWTVVVVVAPVRGLMMAAVRMAAKVGVLAVVVTAVQEPLEGV